MTVRADWGATAVETPLPASAQVDPLAVASSVAMLPMKPGGAEKPVDLNTPTPDLRDWLGELIRREANLDACGTHCPLKDMPDGNCTACPVSRARETTGSVEELRLAGLCRVGREQERVSMLLLAQRHHGV